MSGALSLGNVGERANEFSIVGGGAVGIVVDVGGKGGIAGAVNSRGAVEGVDGEAGVVGDGVLTERRGKGSRFDACVFDE